MWFWILFVVFAVSWRRKTQHEVCPECGMQRDSRGRCFCSYRGRF